jgi:NRPS condensation-like uncharacterized protein
MKMDLKNNTLLRRTFKIIKPSARIRASALDKLMHYSHQYHDGQCRCVIRFDGKIDISRLARAVELSHTVAPILDYRFVYHPWQSSWKKEALSNRVIPFRHAETNDPEKETCRFLAEPMDIKQGTQLSIYLMRSEYDTLCVKLSHMVADARGLLDYIAILSSLYCKLYHNPEYFPRETPKFKRGLGQVFRQIGIPVLIKGFFNWSYPKSDWGFPKVNSDFSAAAFPFRLIGQERLFGIKTFCAEKGFRFTDVITAVFYQSMIDILNPLPDSLLPVQMTMDLRSYLSSGKVASICNMTGAYYPVVRYTKGSSFDQILLDVIKGVAEAREKKSWIGGVVFLELICKFPGFVQTLFARRVINRELSSGTSHPFFSNLGVIDPNLIDFGELKADDLGLFGPVSFPPNFLATVYSFRGQLYINSSFCPTAADPQLVDRFLDNFMNYLPN